MFSFFKDYYWQRGRPQGRHRFAEGLPPSGKAYKIVVDPYFKRFTVEEYLDGRFHEIVYDSALFDFRHLKPIEQNAWLKEFINDSTCLIRNQDDRIILKEEYLFEEGLCRECKVFYPNGILLSVQKMSYRQFGDSFDGVDLYDQRGKVVVHKEYKPDESGEFSEMLKEEWEMTPVAEVLTPI